MAYRFLAYPCSCELSELLLGCVRACGQGFLLRLVTADLRKPFSQLLMPRRPPLSNPMWYLDTPRAVIAQVRMESRANATCAASAYLGEFRSDLEAFLSRETGQSNVRVREGNVDSVITVVN
jgi:hypothetical protein